MTRDSQNSPLLDSGSHKAHICNNEYACRNQSFAMEITCFVATDKQRITGTVQDGDLYSVRLEVIKGGHTIDLRVHPSLMIRK
jgi:hypothetical protein